MKIKVLSYDLSVCQVKDYSLVHFDAEFFCIQKTKIEKSLVCITKDIPENVVRCEDGWKAFYIDGTLDFSLIGILATISSALANHGISIFALSTYSTDYVLVKKEKYEMALEVLQTLGYEIDL